MNRLSWDTTAPRRLTGRRAAAPQPRPEDPFFTPDADPSRSAWRQLLRLTTF
jgi:hypothetical protein